MTSRNPSHPGRHRRLAVMLGTGLLVFTAACETAETPDAVVVEDPVTMTGEVALDTMADSMMTGAANDFRAFLATAPQPGMEHEYTADGLRRLADAIDARLTAPAADTDELRRTADAIQQDPAADTHADRVRRALTTAATLIGQLPGQTAGDQLTSAANAITPGQPLLEQTPAVQRFFEAARDAM